MTWDATEVCCTNKLAICGSKRGNNHYLQTNFGFVFVQWQSAVVRVSHKIFRRVLKASKAQIVQENGFTASSLPSHCSYPSLNSHIATIMIYFIQLLLILKLISCHHLLTMSGNFWGQIWIYPHSLVQTIKEDLKSFSKSWRKHLLPIQFNRFHKCSSCSFYFSSASDLISQKIWESVSIVVEDDTTDKQLVTSPFEQYLILSQHLCSSALLYWTSFRLKLDKLLGHLVSRPLGQDTHHRCARLIGVNAWPKRTPAHTALSVCHISQLNHGHTNHPVCSAEAIILHCHLELIAVWGFFTEDTAKRKNQ